MTTQTTACGPSHDGASTRCARSWSACGRETHECGADGAGSVDTYVSSKILRELKNFATREPTILMGVAPACQRTPAYATFALLVCSAGAARAWRMAFGLLPKFSTPVQKPVEIGVLRRTNSRKLHVYGLFWEAKVRRPRFDATFLGHPIIRTASAVWRRRRKRKNRQ